MVLLSSRCQGGMYLMYGLINVLALLFVVVSMPETKCRTWREIEAMLLLPPRPKLRDVVRTCASSEATEPLLLLLPSNGSSPRAAQQQALRTPVWQKQKSFG